MKKTVGLKNHDIFLVLSCTDNFQYVVSYYLINEIGLSELNINFWPFFGTIYFEHFVKPLCLTHEDVFNERLRKLYEVGRCRMFQERLTLVLISRHFITSTTFFHFNHSSILTEIGISTHCRNKRMNKWTFPLTSQLFVYSCICEIFLRIFYQSLYNNDAYSKWISFHI